MNTKDFATRTMFLDRRNPSVKGYWTVALDIGYSAVKGFSPNRVWCFPSYAREFHGKNLEIAEPGPNDIQYRDEKGVVWNVGYSAQNSLAGNDTNDSLSSLFGRDRYAFPMFLVIARVGIAAGLVTNQYGDPNGKQLYLQTGLPPAYIKMDAPYLKKALVGRHVFDVKIGSEPWRRFDFTLTADTIRVMPQPMGSLLSAAHDNNAQLVPEANKYFSSNVLILDAGFGTVDTYSIRHRQVETNWQSFDNLGMKAVLEDASTEIFARYGVDIPVPSMQKSLYSGFIRVFEREKMCAYNQPFDDILSESNKKVCLKAIEKLKMSYNYLVDYDYLLLTGGTGAAWQVIIEELFANMQTLKIIGGNQNDTLSHVFSNVRGYYLYQVGALRQKVAVRDNEN